MGGMYLPTEKKLYLAKAGEGARLNDHVLKLPPSIPLSEHLVAYSFDFSEDAGKTRSEMDMMARLSRSVRNIRSTNSLVDFCYVAEGKLGATLNQQTKIWDIAVAWLLIRELGGTVSDIDGNKIQFDLSEKALSQNYTIISSGPGLHQKILETIHSK
jgi:myo-inositol-1(or 4)-monophosphatase